MQGIADLSQYEMNISYCEILTNGSEGEAEDEAGLKKTKAQITL
jgi:hypothetical protein